MAITGARKKISFTALSLTTGAAMMLAGCGAPPASTGTDATGSAKAQDFTACIVSDDGGFNDQSFNQSSYEGLKKAETDYGVKIKQAQSQSEADFAPNLAQMMQAGCNLTISVGFKLADATAAAAKDNPDAKFAIIDYGQSDEPNVKPIEFDTAQAAFLAGYLAAGQSKTGKVGTFGGEKIPTVTVFMDGFADGVAYYNKQKGKDVSLLGWDKAAQNGAFTNTFSVIQEGTKAAQNLINEGADIVMPVAGPLGAGAGDAVLGAKKAGKDVSLIWVDSDGYDSAPKYQSVLLTSVTKGMTKSTEDVIKETMDGKFSAEPYVGTLSNDGVGLAPFHNLDGQVSEGMKADLDKVKQGIIDGSIKVDSPSSPK